MMDRLRNDEGFTLIELLVSISVGVVVVMGAFTIVDQALPFSTRVADRTAAQARGRTALEQVMRELRSVVCWQKSTGTWQMPFEAGTNSSVTFYAQTYGAATTTSSDPAIVNTFTPEKRTFTFNASDELVETRVIGTAGTDWTFGATPITRQVLSNVVQDGTTPFFRFYAPDSTTALPTPLSAADAARVNRVDVAFSAGPGKSSTAGTSHYAQLSDSAVVQIPVDYTDATTTAKGPQCAL